MFRHLSSRHAVVAGLSAAAALLAGPADGFSAACPAPRDPTFETKIVGGAPARIEHWPGQVVLRVLDAGTGEAIYFCGGTVIASRWVLTAAHCLEGIERDAGGVYADRKGRRMQIVLDRADLADVAPANIREPVRHIVPEGYRYAPETGRDIALLELDAPWGGPFARLALDARADPPTPPGARVKVAGFGLLASQAKGGRLNRFRQRSGGTAAFLAGSKTLLETSLPTVPLNVCKARYGRAKIGEGQMCAGFELGGTDTCQGDSGGPLVAYDGEGCPYQIGIVSWGAGCAEAGSYGVYTRVSHFAKWILSHVGKLGAESAGPVVARRASVPARPAIAQLEALLAEGKGRVRVALRPQDGGPARTRARVGERFVFEVVSEVAGHLILIDIDAKGRVTQIFPNKYTASEHILRIRAGEAVTVPGKGYGFSWFRARPPVGRGTLIAIVVPEGVPVARWQTHLRREAKDLDAERTPTAYLMGLVDGVLAEARRWGGARKRAPLQGWAFTHVAYEITPAQ